MTAYATVSHVERLDGALTFTGSSKPTASEVIGFLEDTGAELDGILAAQDYTVPVPSTATGAYRLMQRYNAQGANALALTAAPDHPLAEAATKAWQKTIEMLRTGAVELPAAPRDTTDAKVRTRIGADGAASPFFHRDMQL